MAIQARYSCLRNEFLSSAHCYIDNNSLKTLKEDYTQYVNSNRKLSSVKSLKELLTLLEKRDILNCDNIKSLNYIYDKFVNEPDLQEKLKAYDNYLQSVQHPRLCNMYKNEIGDESEGKTELLNEIDNHTSQQEECHRKLVSLIESVPSTSEKEQTRTTSFGIEREKTLRRSVLLQVSERLGRSWRDVARHLDIQECQIDMLQAKYPSDLKAQSYEALKICILQSNTNNWKFDLMRALEKARRRDLKEMVEKLIMS